MVAKTNSNVTNAMSNNVSFKESVSICLLFLLASSYNHGLLFRRIMNKTSTFNIQIPFLFSVLLRVTMERGSITSMFKVNIIKELSVFCLLSDELFRKSVIS